jgi:hypothetical protein
MISDAMRGDGMIALGRVLAKRERVIILHLRVTQEYSSSPNISWEAEPPTFAIIPLRQARRGVTFPSIAGEG